MAIEIVDKAEPSVQELPRALHQKLLEALRGLRFGQVTLTVQDGRVIQVERTDRFRLDRSDR